MEVNNVANAAAIAAADNGNADGNGNVDVVVENARVRGGVKEPLDEVRVIVSRQRERAAFLDNSRWHAGHGAGPPHPVDGRSQGRVGVKLEETLASRPDAASCRDLEIQFLQVTILSRYMLSFVFTSMLIIIAAVSPSRIRQQFVSGGRYQRGRRIRSFPVTNSAAIRVGRSLPEGSSHLQFPRREFTISRREVASTVSPA
jgi:hypothetical protein